MGCVRSNSSFIRKGIRATGAPVMSAEPGNLCGLNSFKFSGLANKKLLNIATEKNGRKESIVLTTRHKKGSRASRPESMFIETGIKKDSKKGLEQLSKVIDAGFYRKDLLDLATAKYAKIKTS